MPMTVGVDLVVEGAARHGRRAAATLRLLLVSAEGLADEFGLRGLGLGLALLSLLAFQIEGVLLCEVSVATGGRRRLESARASGATKPSWP
eukprot:14516599-Alexandrium_andersonii.AAC.1